MFLRAPQNRVVLCVCVFACVRPFPFLCLRMQTTTSQVRDTHQKNFKGAFLRVELAYSAR